MKVRPMGMLLMMLAGWINRHQKGVIVYVRASMMVPLSLDRHSGD